MALSSLYPHDVPPVGVSATNNEGGTYAVGVVIKPSYYGGFSSIWCYVGADDLGTVAAKVHIYRFVAVNEVPVGTTSYITQDFFLRNTIGWQEIVLDSPVLASAGMRYVISVSFPETGAYYSSVADAFTTDIVAGDIVAESRAAVHNGRYSDDNSDTLHSQYPMSNFTPASYCIDVTYNTDLAAKGLYHFKVNHGGTLSHLELTMLS